MIENKSVRITCDFCHKVVAVKKLFGFKTLRDYCTIGKEHVTDLISDCSEDIHLCNDCYHDVRNYVVDALGKRRRQP